MGLQLKSEITVLHLFQAESGGAFKGFKGFVLPSGGGGFSGFGNGTGTKPLGGLSNGGSGSIANSSSFTNLKTAAETTTTFSKFTSKIFSSDDTCKNAFNDIKGAERFV